MRLKGSRAAILLSLALVTPTRAAPLSGENCLAPLPKGFKVAAANRSGRIQLVEYTPQGETVANWTRIVTHQIVHGVRNANPDALAMGMQAGWIGSCPGGAAQKVWGGVDNGYAVSLWMFLCPLNPATRRPERVWMKTISGADSLYSAQYALREQATAEMIGPVMSYLRSVTVCDTRRDDAKCPVIDGASGKAP